MKWNTPGTCYFYNTTPMTKLKFLSIVFSVIYWILVAFYFVTVRYMGLGEFAPPDLDYGTLAGYASIVGFSIGLLFGLFPLGKILRFRKRQSFLSTVLLGTSSYILFFSLVIFLASLYGNSFDFALSHVASPDGLITLFHLSISSLLYHFVLQISRKFGPGVLFEYTVGKYFAPKVEQRAFMFLDLRSSTRLAEMLEHVSYSSLVQDCYAELTQPLIDYNAHVYQYVGDEVVVTWKVDRSFSAEQCHQFFYAFQRRLQSRKEYFKMLYGALPEFKAGVHCGNVTVAEVGELKTEIAYHGDVLNTASRIQSLCNTYQTNLLLSDALISLLSDKFKAKVKFIDRVELRGKESITAIYTISD